MHNFLLEILDSIGCCPSAALSRQFAQVAAAHTHPQTDPMPASKVWSGSISLGLVNVPVGLYSATEDKSVRFHRYHEKDGGRIRQKRICEVDGQELDVADIARGYELPGGDTVVMTDSDFEGLPVPTLKTITVEAFVPAEQIDPIMYSWFRTRPGRGPTPSCVTRPTRPA